MEKNHFSFGTDFQWELLKYIILNKGGALIIPKIKDDYFTLIEHQVIAMGIIKFYGKYKRAPSLPILKEEISELLTNRKYSELVTKDDVTNINDLVNKLYKGGVKDSEIIKENIYRFSAYVEMKNLNESFDLSDFSQYEEYHKKIARIISNANPKKEDEPDFLVKDVIERQFERQDTPQVVPTPFRQVNALTNAGGLEKGSIVVLLDKPKATKTFNLVNVARGYLRMKKNVLYIDLENGKKQIMSRLEQSTLKKTKMDLLSGNFDKLEQKHLRKYKRLGVEFIVERLPANVGNANHIKRLIEKIEQKEGIKINVLIIDFLGKMASINGDKEDTERISNAYIDIANLLEEMNIDHCWTAQHVTRKAEDHQETKYEENDIAKCIDIIRHAQVIFGLNSTQDERDHNIQRWELVCQRDGKPFGRALFNVDLDKQRSDEFTVSQRKTYDEKIGNQLDEEFKKKSKSFKNPNEKPINKQEHGDI